MVSLITTLENSIYLNITSDKGANKIKTTKRSIISSISSTKLTKFHNQPVVPLGRNLLIYNKQHKIGQRNTTKSVADHILK